MPQKFLVTGATGAQGGATARELLNHGAKVHALVRNTSSPAAQALQSLGAILFQGDFSSLPAISAAMKGVTGVFLNTYPSFTDPAGEILQAQNLVSAALAIGTVTIFVVSTVYKASEQAELTAAKKNEYPFLNYYYERKEGVEKVVREAGFENWTVLRPDWLDYNYLAPGCAIHFPEYQKEHVLTVSYDRAFKQKHFDPYDVGKFAAAALLRPEGFNGHVIELTGEPLAFDEIAECLSEVSGVQVRARFRTEEETAELLASKTLPVLERQLWAREFSLEYDPNALDKYGIKLGTLTEYLERERGKLLKTLGVDG